MRLSRKEINKVQINGEHSDTIILGTNKSKLIEKHFYGCSFWKIRSDNLAY
jgi:hypothetical protein